jgi:hypothetical protein
MSSYHDCDHFCITPMVDLMFMRWFMRCKDVYVLDVWVDVYVTPFLFACSDQTSMHRAREGDVCISWSNLVVLWGSDRNLYCYGFLPFYGWLTRENSLLCIKVLWQKWSFACKDASVFSTSCYSSLCNTLLSLKIYLRWTLLSKVH